MAWQNQTYSPTKGCFMSNDTVKSKSETKTKSKPLAPKPKSPTKGAFEKTIFSIDPIELEMVEPKSFGVETIEIGKASGRYQVLFIYPKDNTSGCTQEAQDFSALKPQFDALKIDLLGVSKDSLKMHVKFIQTQALTINLISDPDTLLINALGSWVEKVSMAAPIWGLIDLHLLLILKAKLSELGAKLRSLIMPRRF